MLRKWGAHLQTISDQSATGLDVIPIISVNRAEAKTSNNVTVIIKAVGCPVCKEPLGVPHMPPLLRGLQNVEAMLNALHAME